MGVARGKRPMRESPRQEESNMVKAIVGANWGDEGKGKITDMMADQSDIVVRFQGDRKSVV